MGSNIYYVKDDSWVVSICTAVRNTDRPFGCYSNKEWESALAYVSDSVSMYEWTFRVFALHQTHDPGSGEL